jgi:hypothetical protein
MQTKSNFWVALVIWENMLLMAILLAILTTFAALAVPALAAPSWSIVESIVGILLFILAVWLGVKSASKKTRIDSKNVLPISIITIALPLALLIIMNIYVYSQYQTINWASFGEALLGNAVVFLVVFYFLKKRSAVAQS